MSEFLRSVLAQDEAVVVSTVVTYDLPVNPLGHILFTLKALNNTAVITNYSYLRSLLSQIANVEVLFKGSSVISGSFTDIALVSALLTGRAPGQFNTHETDNDVRGVTVTIPFGRKLFDPNECFPAIRKGELQLRVTYAAAQTGIDAPVAQIETVELLDAAPTRFLKYTTSSKTPNATGEHDVDLPIGNDILKVLLFGTTVPTGASYNASIGNLRLKVDNTDNKYALTNWESLHNELFGGVLTNFDEHIHSVNAAGAAREDTSKPERHLSLVENYALLDFDPDGTGAWALKTEGRSRVHLRINADVADAIRVLPVELLQLSAPTGA